MSRQHHQSRIYALTISLVLILAAAAFLFVAVLGTSPNSSAAPEPLPGGTPPPIAESSAGSLAVLVESLPAGDDTHTLPALPTEAVQ